LGNETGRPVAEIRILSVGTGGGVEDEPDFQVCGWAWKKSRGWRGLHGFCCDDSGTTAAPPSLRDTVLQPDPGRILPANCSGPGEDLMA
jgi:hypothetical protein